MYRTDHFHPHAERWAAFGPGGPGHPFGSGGPGHPFGSRARRGAGRPDLRSSGLGRSTVALLSALRAAAHAGEDQRARIRAIVDGARSAVFSVLAEPAAPTAAPQPADAGAAPADAPTAAAHPDDGE